MSNEKEKVRRWANNHEIRVLKSDFTITSWRDRGKWYDCDSYKHHKYFEPIRNGGFNPFDIAVIKVTESIVLLGEITGLANELIPKSEVRFST